MKFFILLNSKHKDSWYSSTLYGPYENDEAVEKEIARLWPHNTTQRYLVFEGKVMSVKPSPKEKPESKKREPGNTKNYVKNGNGWKCKDCGADILGATVAHPVWIRGFNGGFGQCKNETLPYCPNCEKKPNSQGAPIYDE
ncbi:MAG: hypothetical protein HZA35_00735 [Parcubacteria group bacterium]|nr:hypothetical protein [Parcubacteria group bacterium]